MTPVCWLVTIVAMAVMSGKSAAFFCGTIEQVTE